MNSVIEKMEEIHHYTKHQRESGHWDQKTALDLHQEMTRQNHIFHHIGRASANPSGRWFGVIVGGFGGLLVTSIFVSHPSLNRLQTCGQFLGGSLAGSFIGWGFMRKHFGDKNEYKLFKKNKVKTDKMMAEFETLFE